MFKYPNLTIKYRLVNIGLKIFKVEKWKLNIFLYLLLF